MEWDTAAGQCILEQAGGALLNYETGLPLDYNKAAMQNPYFIAKAKQ
jgi:3'(2'), 5'-bisphosphate nucleotidase